MDKPTIADMLDKLPDRSDVKVQWPDLGRGRPRVIDRSTPVVVGGSTSFFGEQTKLIANMMGLPLRYQTQGPVGYPSFHERLAVARNRIDEFLAYTLDDVYRNWSERPVMADLYYLPRAPYAPRANALRYLRQLTYTDRFMAMGGQRFKPRLIPVPPLGIPRWLRSEFAPQYVRCEWKRYMMASTAWSSRPYQLYTYFDSLTPITTTIPVEAMRLNRKIRGAQDVGIRGKRENPIVGWPYWLERDVDKDIDRWANRR